MRQLMNQLKKVIMEMMDAYEMAQMDAINSGDPFRAQNFRSQVLY